MQIIQSGEILGARVEGLDLSQPLSPAQFVEIEQALGRYGVLSYPKQVLTSLQLKQFAERFGQLEINVANAYQEPGLPLSLIHI
jgi:taurine dioxygenase